ncbi:MAG: hypothetical protein R3257_02385 [bacterium]|nr:hypothetical protein [bacterium]
MKKLVYLVLFLGVLALPQAAHSRNVGAQIQSGVIWYEADDECAVEVEFTSFEGGGFITGFEGLYINGTLWADLQDLPTEGYQAGDKVAFGTEALGIKWNYSFDVQLRADFCTGLKLGDTISYRGTDGTDLSSYELTQEPMLMGAYDYNKGTGKFDYVDLNVTRLSLTNLWDTTISFGGGEAPSTNGGDGGGGQTGTNCSIGNFAGGMGSLSGWLSFAALVGLMTWRRFRA